MKLKRAWRSFRDRNWLAARALRRACGGGEFVCRGYFQLAIDPAAHLIASSSPSFLGVRLLGDITPVGDVTVVAVGKDATLCVDGLILGRGARLSILPGGRLEIGHGTYVNDGSRVYASKSVRIGRRCAISWGVTVIDHDGHGAGASPMSAPVVIEDDVWIGCNVTILKGVTIGAGSAVAAGAVVNRSCPPKSLIGGVPARVLRCDYQWKTNGDIGATAARSAR
jgi:acetyltransferase-like isoleucine patch superfamily enzyme